MAAPGRYSLDSCAGTIPTWPARILDDSVYPRFKGGQHCFRVTLKSSANLIEAHVRHIREGSVVRIRVEETSVCKRSTGMARLEAVYRVEALGD